MENNENLKSKISREGLSTLISGTGRQIVTSGVSDPPWNVDLIPFYLAPSPSPPQKNSKYVRPLIYEQSPLKFWIAWLSPPLSNVTSSKKQRFFQGTRFYFQQWNNIFERWNMNIQLQNLKIKGELGFF